jgi:hypothetical protein
MFQYTPGVIWTAIIVALVLLAEWLGAYFNLQPWVPPLVGFITAVLVPVLKVLAPPPDTRSVNGLAADAKLSLHRYLW